ncbi:hypothetical protein [Parafrankia sp. CH37]|uniref:hypothetical protein n=1 Tax=Parafrankia sp. CH37 TaxID=683308 RepID=UPI001041C0D2|nr:hypothetical protein [Parafrankia sp. CH37]
MITVDARRAPIDIARDIERRLLPSYRIALARARDAKRAASATERERRRIIQSLALILPSARIAVEASEHDLEIGGVEGSLLLGRIKVPPSDWPVEMSIDIPKALVLEFARRLAVLESEISHTPRETR